MAGIVIAGAALTVAGLQIVNDAGQTTQGPSMDAARQDLIDASPTWDPYGRVDRDTADGPTPASDLTWQQKRLMDASPNWMPDYALVAEILGPSYAEAVHGPR